MLLHELLCALPRDVARVRLRGARQVEARLGERVDPLGHAHAAQGSVGRHGDAEGARVRVADVLAGEDEHPARDEERVVARLEHAHHPVDGGVRVGPAHRLDERADDVVVLLAGLVVEERPVALGRGDRFERHAKRALAPRFEVVDDELERRQGAPRVAASHVGDREERVLVGREVLCAEAVGLVGERPPEEHRDVFRPERLEVEHLAAREQRRVDGEARVLGRRPDEHDRPVFDVGQERVLLRLVEPVDLVHEEDRALALKRQPVARRRDDLAELAHAAQDGAEGHEEALGRRGDDACNGRLPAPGWPPEDHRAHPVGRDGLHEERARREEVGLADDVRERARSNTVGEGGAARAVSGQSSPLGGGSKESFARVDREVARAFRARGHGT